MARRWIIRGVCLSWLLLCAGAWVASYQQAFVLSFNRPDGPFTFDSYNVGVDNGRAMISNSGGNEDGWNWNQFDYHGQFQEYYLRTWYHYGGFAYCPNFFNVTPGKGWIVMCPLWFPTAVSGLLLCLVWRKTRYRVVMGGFPVVPAVASSIPVASGM